MKRIFASILLCVIGLSLPSLSYAQTIDTPNTIYLSPQALTKPKNESFTMDIRLNMPLNITEVSDFDLILRYDPRILQVTAIDPAAAFDTPLNASYDNRQGILRFARANLNQIVNSNLSLGTLTFVGKSRGKRMVSFERARITIHTNSGAFSTVQVGNRQSAEITITDGQAENTCNLCLGKSLCLCSFLPPL